MSLTWNDLFKAGSVVDLDMQIWTARVKIRAEDLGLEDSVDVRKALSLGQHRLAPPEEFEEIFKHARAADRSVKSFSLNFPFIRGARYVPEKNMGPLLKELKTDKEFFNTAVDAFIGKYDTIRSEMLPVIEKALKDAAKNPLAAERAFVRIQGEYPSSEEVRSKFRLSWSMYAVQGASTASVKDAVKEEGNNVKSIVEDMIVQLRQEAVEKVKQILRLTDKGGKLRKDTLESAMAMVDRLEALNVMGDGVLAQQISALRSSLTSVGEEVPGKEFSKGLKDIEQELTSSVEEAVKEAEKNLCGLGRRKLAV